MERGKVRRLGLHNFGKRWKKEGEFACRPSFYSHLVLCSTPLHFFTPFHPFPIWVQRTIWEGGPGPWVMFSVCVCVSPLPHGHAGWGWGHSLLHEGGEVVWPPGAGGGGGDNDGEDTQLQANQPDRSFMSQNWNNQRQKPGEQRRTFYLIKKPKKNANKKRQ